jgi:hypothetical protein
MSLARDAVAYRDVPDVRTDLDDLAVELVTRDEGRLDLTRGPRVPGLNM